MPETAQIELLPATEIARTSATHQAPNGINYAAYGDTNIPGPDLDRIVEAVPRNVAAALSKRAYYFVPLTIGESTSDNPLADSETLVAPGYSTELGDRAICHRNLSFHGVECVFISTRLMQDRFALAFEFFINIGHNFVEATGVPASFANLVWKQASEAVRGETSQDAWEHRIDALGPQAEAAISEPSRLTRFSSRVNGVEHSTAPIARASADRPAQNEKAKTAYIEAAFSDTIAIYLLSLAVDFDYYELREREYPLLAPSALAERLRHIAHIFPPNPGYEFSILYRRRQ